MDGLKAFRFRIDDDGNVISAEREDVLAEVKAARMEDEFATALVRALTDESATVFGSAIEVDCFGAWDDPRVVLALLRATDEDIRKAWATAKQRGADVL